MISDSSKLMAGADWRWLSGTYGTDCPNSADDESSSLFVDCFAASPSVWSAKKGLSFCSENNEVAGNTRRLHGGAG